MSWYRISYIDWVSKTNSAAFTILSVYNTVIQNGESLLSKWGHMDIWGVTRSTATSWTCLSLGTPKHKDFFFFPFFSMADEIPELEHRFYIIKSKFIAKIILQHILEKKKIVFSPCSCGRCEWLTWTVEQQLHKPCSPWPLGTICRLLLTATVEFLQGKPSQIRQSNKLPVMPTHVQLSCSGVWPHVGHAFRLALWMKSNLQMERSHGVVH